MELELVISDDLRKTSAQPQLTPGVTLCSVTRDILCPDSTASLPSGSGSESPAENYDIFQVDFSVS